MNPTKIKKLIFKVSKKSKTSLEAPYVDGGLSPYDLLEESTKGKLAPDLSIAEPIIEEETSAHEVTTDNEQPVSESIRLMNQEKQLVGLIIQQADELDRLKQELTACQDRLSAKGWVLTNTGEWGIE